jgi:hypothetical protein
MTELDYAAEARLYGLYADTDKARLAWRRQAKQWEAIADALAEVLRRNGVGGRAYNSALDLYEQQKAESNLEKSQ